MDRIEFIEEIKSLLTGQEMPDLNLYQKGEFPNGWVARYLELLSSNRNYWQNIDSWPRDLFYCFYRVGFHLGFAYSTWVEENQKSNEKTESDLHKIRLFTEAFVTGSANEEWTIET